MNNLSEEIFDNNLRLKKIMEEPGEVMNDEPVRNR